MAKQNQKSAANDIQNLFDPQNYQNVFKTWATTNERLTELMVGAGERTTDITSETAKEAFSNLRDVSQVRDEPAEYGQAYSDFVQKQMDLFMRAARSLAEVSQKPSTETAELASEAGEQITGTIAANTERATDKASSVVKKAA